MKTVPLATSFVNQLYVCKLDARAMTAVLSDYFHSPSLDGRSVKIKEPLIAPLEIYNLYHIHVVHLNSSQLFQCHSKSVFSYLKKYLLD